MLLEHVGTQLRTRVIQEVERLVMRRDSKVVFGPVNENDFPQHRASDSVLAVLDFRDPTAADTGDPSEATHRLNGSTISMMYPLVSASSALPASAYPVYIIPRLFSSDNTLAIRRLLGEALATATRIALCQPPTAHQGADPVPLGIALWRLRLWHGGGWTIPSDGADSAAQEDVRHGRVVEGFKTVQGVLHSRWP